jgi:hypothetical protein
MIRADQAYYSTHCGDVVGEDHPDRYTLLCKQGELISDDLARKVGLIEPVGNPVQVEAPAAEVEAEAEVQAVTTPPRTQAVTPPKKKTSPRKR